MKLMLLTSAATALLLASSCDKDEQDRLTQKDKDFMTRATYINLGEIYSGNITQERASDVSVKEYGSMMITDHANAQERIAKIASSADYTLPQDTDQEHKTLGEMLSTLSGPQFDSTYLYKMVEGHDKAISLYDDEAANGSDAETKQYAASTVDIIRHHRMKADSLAKALYP
jgi:putative membrane protein